MASEAERKRKALEEWFERKLTRKTDFGLSQSMNATQAGAHFVDQEGSQRDTLRKSLLDAEPFPNAPTVGQAFMVATAPPEVGTREEPAPVNRKLAATGLDL